MNQWINSSWIYFSISFEHIWNIVLELLGKECFIFEKIDFSLLINLLLRNEKELESHINISVMLSETQGWKGKHILTGYKQSVKSELCYTQRLNRRYLIMDCYTMSVLARKWYHLSFKNAINSISMGILSGAWRKLGNQATPWNTMVA